MNDKTKTWGQTDEEVAKPIQKSVKMYFNFDSQENISKNLNKKNFEPL